MNLLELIVNLICCHQAHAVRFLGGLVDSIMNLALNCLVGFIASMLSVVLVLMLERRTRPELEIIECKPTPQTREGDPTLTRLHVKVTNTHLSPWLGRFWDRKTAVGCRAWISFYANDHSLKLDHKRLARWKENPSPEIPDYWIKQRILPKGLQETVDIQPDMSEKIDIAVKFKDEANRKDEKECYFWNDENYLYLPPDYKKYRHPEHKLEPGVYYVRIVVKSGGREFPALFKLFNDESFHLEKIGKKEKTKLMKSLSEPSTVEPC